MKSFINFIPPVLTLSLLCFTLNLYAQPVTYYDTTRLYISATNHIICKGQQTALTVDNGFNVTMFGSGDIQSHHMVFQQTGLGAELISCTILSTANPRITGPTIINTSVQPEWVCQGEPEFVNNANYSITAIASPTETADYSLSWDQRIIYEYINFEGQVSIQETNRHFYAAPYTITVIDPPTPVITVLTPEVEPGQNITFLFENYTPEYRVAIEDGCGNELANNLRSFTNDLSYSLASPPYFTKRSIKAKYYWAGDESCTGPWSQFTTVKVRPLPDDMPCNDPELARTEQILQNPATLTRSDYHNYPVLSNPFPQGEGSTLEQMDDIFDFIKSNPYYQLPTSDDFINSSTIMPPSLIGLNKAPFNPSELSNCETYNLPSTGARLLLGGGISFAGIEIEVNGEDCNINTFDPVRVVVNESNYCITNYTLPGYILNPGKVQRCLIADECGNITIVTTGTGVTCHGDGNIGEALKEENVRLGEIGFNALNIRLLRDYD